MDIKELRVICDEVKILMKTIEIIEEANHTGYGTPKQQTREYCGLALIASAQ